ncbi:MAG: Uncharacterised protein [Cryomorphaceae bacterium]|jgi:putative transcriptional regulator|nr:MAG: Uncharacterised protein [Cryomorphaceae bacterium]
MKEKKALAPGSLLISKPLIGDGFFEQSVVYLTSHDQEGSLGFTLNKSSSLIAGDVIEELEGRDPIYYGGPVEQDGLFYLHAYENIPGAAPVGNGLFLGGDFELFQQALRTARILSHDSPGPKLFLGYSGWSPGQLEQELRQDTWIVVPPPLDLHPLEIQDEAWREMMTRLGGEFALWANAPEDPLLN